MIKITIFRQGKIDMDLKQSHFNCDTCFNKKYYPPQAIADACKFCKENNMRFYRQDLTDLIVNISVLKENAER